MELKVNPSWTFKEAVDNLKTLREQYKETLASFSYFDLHEKVIFLKKTRDSFYALELEEAEKDKLWDYMNGFEFLYVLKNCNSYRRICK